MRRTVDFAVENGFFLPCHGDRAALEILYGHDAKARIVWAHTGFSLDGGQVAELLARYPALWVELSYRGGITDGAGQIMPPWKALFEWFPDRCLIGLDAWIHERGARCDASTADYRQ